MSTIANVSLGVTVNKASLTQAERDIQAAISRIEKLSASGALIGKGYTQPLGRITGAANEFEKSLEAANARVVAFGASAGAILLVQRALEGLVRSTIEVEKSLTEINTLLNLSSSGLSKFGDQLFAVASGTGQAFEVASKAALEFSRQGLGLEETLKRTRDALILSRLSGLDVVASTTALTAAMNSFNESVIDSTELVNKLANVDAAFAVSSADLAEAIKRVGSTAQDAGVGIDELIALVTSAQQVTARGGSVIGNSLKTIFTRAQRPEVLNDLHNFGVAVKDSSGAALPAIQILKNFANAYDGLSSSQKSSSTELLGGVYQINILKAAIGDLGKEFSIYDSALRTSSSATNEASVRNEVLNKTLSALLIQTTNNLTKVGAAAGKLTIEPALRNVLGFVNDSLDELSEKNPEDVGSKIGKGILEGIGRVISGPGLILFGALFGKLAVNFISFSGNALKTFAGLNEGARHQAELQQLIQNLLLKNPQLINAATSSAQGQLAVEKEILRVVRDRNSALQKSSDLSEKMAANITLQSPRPSRGRAAGGLIPNFAASDKNSEIIGAITGGYNPGQVKQMSIPGLGRVTYNTAETVKQFPGMSQPAIMPPKESEAGKNYGKSFKKTHGFNPYAFDGHEPEASRAFVASRVTLRGQGVRDGDSLLVNFTPASEPVAISSRLIGADAYELWDPHKRKKDSILTAAYEGKNLLIAYIKDKFGSTAAGTDVTTLFRAAGLNVKEKYGRPFFRADDFKDNLLKNKLGVPYGGEGSRASKTKYKGLIPNFEKTIDPSKLTRWDKIKYFNPGFSVFRQPYLKPDGTGVGRKEIGKDPIAWGNAYEMFLKNGGLQSIGFSDPKHILGGTPIDFLARYKTGDPYALDAKIGHDDAKSSSVQRKLDTMIPFIRGQSFQGRLFKTEFLEHGFKEEELDRLKTGIVFGNASDKETGSKQIARAATAGVSVGGKSQFANMSSGFVPNFDRAFARKGEAVMPGPAAFTKIYKDQLAKKISFLDFDGTLIHTKGDVEYAKASTPEAKSKVLQDFFTNPGRINDIKSAKLTSFGSDLKAKIDANKILPNLLGIMTASDKTAGIPEYINRTWKIPMENQRYGDKTGTKAAEMAKLRAAGKLGKGPHVGRLVDDLAVQAMGFVPNFLGTFPSLKALTEEIEKRGVQVIRGSGRTAFANSVYDYLELLNTGKVNNRKESGSVASADGARFLTLLNAPATEEQKKKSMFFTRGGAPEGRRHTVDKKYEEKDDKGYLMSGAYGGDFLDMTPEKYTNITGFPVDPHDFNPNDTVTGNSQTEKGNPIGFNQFKEGSKMKSARTKKEYDLRTFVKKYAAKVVAARNAAKKPGEKDWITGFSGGFVPNFSALSTIRKALPEFPSLTYGGGSLQLGELSAYQLQQLPLKKTVSDELSKLGVQSVSGFSSPTASKALKTVPTGLTVSEKGHGNYYQRLAPLPAFAGESANEVMAQSALGILPENKAKLTRDGKINVGEDHADLQGDYPLEIYRDRIKSLVPESQIPANLREVLKTKAPGGRVEYAPKGGKAYESAQDTINKNPKLIADVRRKEEEKRLRGYSRGFIPNFGIPAIISHDKNKKFGEETFIKAGERSQLIYTEDDEKLNLESNLSQNKGDGFAQFQDLAKTAHQKGKPIYSSSLAPQVDRIDGAKAKDTNFNALRTAFPQLDYRMIGGFQTAGEYSQRISSSSRLFLPFSSLDEVKKRVNDPAITREQFNNALESGNISLHKLTTRRLKEGPGDAPLRNAFKGFVPNFGPNIHSPELFSRQPGSRSTTHKLPFLGKSFGRLMGLVNRFNENPLFTGTVRYQKGVGLVGSLSHFKDFLEREDPGLRRTVGLAEGFVPNFNALKDSIDREKAAGYSSGQIRVGKDSSLVTSWNPDGAAVFNSTEGSLKRALSMHRSSGKSPEDLRSQGASKGFVPNLAVDKIDVAIMMASLVGLSSAFAQLKDSGLILSKTQKEANSIKLKELEVSKRTLETERKKAESGAKGAQTKLNSNQTEEKQAALDKANLKLARAQSGAKGAQTKFNNNPSEAKQAALDKANLKLARAQSDAKGAQTKFNNNQTEGKQAALDKANLRLARAEKALSDNKAETLNTQQSQTLRGRLEKNAGQVGMAAAFAAPMVTSMATQFMPSATEGQAQGKAAVEGLGDVVSMAGTGASIGAIFGPLGAGIGTAIGGLVGLTMAIGKVDEAATNFKIEQVTLKLEQIDAKNQQVAQSFQSYIDGAEKLSNAFENPEKTRPQDLIRIKDQMAKSMQGIPDEFKNKFDSSLGSVEKMRLVFAEITEDLGRQKADLVAAKSTFEMLKATTGWVDRQVFEEKDVKRFKPIAEANVSSAANRSGIQERIKSETLPEDSDYKDLTPDNIEQRFQGLFGESFLGALSTIKDKEGLEVFGQIMKKFIDSAVESAAAVEKSSIILERLAEKNKLWSKQLEYAKSRIIELNTTLAALGESAKNRVFTLKEIASMERKSRADILTTNQKGAIDLGKTFMSEESIAIANSNLKIQELQIQKLEKIDDTIRKSQEDVFGILTKTEKEASEKYLQSIDKAAGTNTPADETQKEIEIYGQWRENTSMRMRDLLQKISQGDFDKNRALEELLDDQRTAAKKAGLSESLIKAMEASVTGAFQALDHSLTDSLAKFETATNAQILIEKEQLKYQILLIQQQKRLQSFGGAGNFSQAGQSGFSSNLDEIQSLYGDRFRALSSGSSVDIGRSSTKYLETLQSDLGIKNLEKEFPPLVREAFRGRSADIFKQGQEIEKFSEIRGVRIPEDNKMTKEKANRLAAEQMSSRLKLESLPDEVQRIRNNSDHLNDLIQYQGEDLVGKNTKAFKDAIEMSGLKGAVDYISTTEQNVGGLLRVGSMEDTNKLLGPLNEIAQKQVELTQAINAQKNLQKEININRQIQKISGGKNDNELTQENRRLFEESRKADAEALSGERRDRNKPRFDDLSEIPNKDPIDIRDLDSIRKRLHEGLIEEDIKKYPNRKKELEAELAQLRKFNPEFPLINRPVIPYRGFPELKGAELNRVNDLVEKQTKQTGPQTPRQRNVRRQLEDFGKQKDEINKLKAELPKPTPAHGPLPGTSLYSDSDKAGEIKRMTQFGPAPSPREDPIREPLEKINRLAKVEALKLTTKDIQAKIDKNEEEQKKLDLLVWDGTFKEEKSYEDAIHINTAGDEKRILEAQKRGYQVILNQKIETEKREKIYKDLIKEEEETRDNIELTAKNEEEMNKLQKRLGEIAVEKAKHTAEQLRVTATEAQNNPTLFSPEKSQKYHDADIASIRAGEYEKVDMKRAIGGRLEYTKIDRQEAIYKSADRFAEQFPDKISGALTEALSGAKTFRQAFSDIFADMGKELLGDAMKMGVRAIISGLKNSFNSGGIVRGYSLGGQVSGGSGTRDDIPAMLSSGEYVVRKAAVNKYGSDFLEKLNKGSLVKRAEGGSADISEQLKYTYNDENRPSEGEFETGGLSLLAIQDQNNPQVKIMEAKEAALRNYLVEKVAFDKAQKDAIKAFKKQQRKQAIMALVQAAISVAGNSIKLPPGGTQLAATSASTAAKSPELFQPYGGEGRGYVPSQPPRYFQPLTLGERGFASGGPSGVDDIPALLTGGEYVMRKDSVEHYGEDFFNRLNRGSIKGYADGGLVGGGRGETVGDTFNKSSVSGGLTNNITISVNITNEGSVSDSKKDQSGTADQEQQEQGKLLSEKVESKIVEILLQEKRPGGILYNPNTKDN